MTNSARLEPEQDPDDLARDGTPAERGSPDGLSKSPPHTSSTYALLAAAALIKTVPAASTPAPAALPEQPREPEVTPRASSPVVAVRTPVAQGSRTHIVAGVLAALVALSIGFYGVPAFRLLRYDIGQNALISGYHQAYAECLATEGNARRCPTLIYYRCVEDPFWKSSPSVPWPLEPNLASAAARCAIS